MRAVQSKILVAYAFVIGFHHKTSDMKTVRVIVLSKNYVTVVVLPTKFLFLRKMKKKSDIKTWCNENHAHPHHITF